MSFEGDESRINNAPSRSLNSGILAGRIVFLAEQAVFSGHASLEEVTPLIDWGAHPDCPPEVAAEIAAVLEQRIETVDKY